MTCYRLPTHERIWGGAAVAGVVPVLSMVRMKVSYSVWSGVKGGDTGHMARGGLVSGAAVTDPIPSTGEGSFPIPAVGRGVDCIPSTVMQDRKSVV